MSKKAEVVILFMGTIALSLTVAAFVVAFSAPAYSPAAMLLFVGSMVMNYLVLGVRLWSSQEGGMLNIANAVASTVIPIVYYLVQGVGH